MRAANCACVVPLERSGVANCKGSSDCKGCLRTAVGSLAPQLVRAERRDRGAELWRRVLAELPNLEPGDDEAAIYLSIYPSIHLLPRVKTLVRHRNPLERTPRRALEVLGTSAC